ncbi:MAG: hypothetical protein A2583_11320 [Bdellovibrionales bacterium RIFOXYD1_FULL_53_11]|nr:MAG: hypothetical protein A2583_11320 [Bdellovibrionales bacterium RIFOXYD1_FULL_53_11]
MKKVMIADDSGTARMFTRRCLEISGIQGAEFIEVPNGVEAMKALADAAVDVIFTDLNMPDMDGVELLREVKASQKLKHIPVIVVTSAHNPAKEAELVGLGAYRVLGKPVSPAIITAAIELLLSDGTVKGGAVKEEVQNVEAVVVEKLHQAVEKAVGETFENMAFLEANRDSDGAFAGVRMDDALWSRLETISPVKGMITILMHPKLASELTRVMFGLSDENPTESMLSDAMNEFVNTIGGRLMRYYVVAEKTFKLGLPSAGRGGVVFSAHAQKDMFTVGDGWLCVVVEGKEMILS